MTHIQKSIFFSILLFLTLTTACKTSKEPSIHIPIHRYEKALLSIPMDSIQEGIAAIQDSFPLFLENTNLSDSLNILKISNFMNDPLVKESNLKIDKKFGNCSELQKQLEFLFQNYTSLFPKEKIPSINTYISNFDYENRVLYVNHILAISLDMYLGESEPNYQALGIPHYLRRRLSPEYIQVDVAKILAVNQIPPTQCKTLLDELIYKGKIIYIVHSLLPKVSEEVILGYTPEQLQWAKENESSVWQYLIQEQLLYETNYTKFKQYFNEGPGNVPFQGSPARLGEWIGLQIISKYASKHTDLSTLLQELDAQIILKDSGYKGK
ncbi:MAG: hypothetical protein RR190_01670 [Bacteroidales bacterium]